jgi:DNA-binding transcriptional LysR family regulator
MPVARRFLPSTTALKVLIELASSGYTTAAARSLNMSQSAVSKQLIALENMIGTPLFTRTINGLVLTKTGAIYLDCATTVIRAIEDASLLTARLKPDQQILRLQVPPILGDKWLLPRFFEFADLHPEIEVQFTNLGALPGTVKADGIFSFSETAPSSSKSLYLFGNDVILVASPEYWKKYGLPEKVADLQNGVLIEHPGTPIDWQHFVTEKKLLNTPVPRFLRFGYYTMAISAALEGKGMVFIPRGLIINDLISGRLINPPNFNYKSSSCYWFTPASDQENLSSLKIFTDWIKTVIETNL